MALAAEEETWVALATGLQTAAVQANEAALHWRRAVSFARRAVGSPDPPNFPFLGGRYLRDVG
eukprot:11772816-Alexandrium_andersonii.AAC.1